MSPASGTTIVAGGPATKPETAPLANTAEITLSVHSLLPLFALFTVTDILTVH